MSFRKLFKDRKSLAVSGDQDRSNPYLSARRSWNDAFSAFAASRWMWQIFGILCLLIVLGAVGGMIYVGSQSKFVPYVIEVDKLGQAMSVGVADKASPVDPRVIKAAVAEFVADARLVTPDIALQRKAVYRVYSMLAQGDSATTKMSEWLNGSEEASPFKKAASQIVDAEITAVLSQTPETWQVDWVETIRDRQGTVKVPAYRMRALVTIYTNADARDVSEEQIRNNPLGIHVRDFSWAKLS